MEDEVDLSQLQNLGLQPVPISHEIPKTTLDSLLQIRGGYNKKIEEAVAQNDASKKRRLERLMKQYDDAIKATKDGKSFNYKSLNPLPGYAETPLQSDGRPILSTGGGSTGSSSTAGQMSHSTSTTVIKKQKVEIDEDEMLERLAKELEENDVDDDHHEDPEEERLNRQINSVMPQIGKMAPMPKEDSDDDELERELAGFTNPNQSKHQPPKVVTNKLPSNDMAARQMMNMPIIIPPPPVLSPTKQARNIKEIAIITERQRLFRVAALEAKREGNDKVAIVYMKHYKGFEQMLKAAEHGLPLDMSNLPMPPQLAGKTGLAVGPQNAAKTSPKSGATASGSTMAASSLNTFEIVNLKEELVETDRESVYRRLIQDLADQIKLVFNNSKHFTGMGDIHNARKFAEMAAEAKKDLDSLKSAFTHNQPLPLYHYEKRTYQTVDCNSDLTDNDLELTVVRAINLPLPKGYEAKGLTTYVKFEFPYPPETAQTDKTNKQTGSLNPEYNQTFKLQIQRTQSKFTRLMNRKDFKFEIFYKAGLFKSDQVLGTCHVKLQQLETDATIHDAFEVLDGRRQLGSKLELKIRIREPLVHKQVKVLEYKWLVIDKFAVSSKF